MNDDQANYSAEYTDTYGGDANYSWVERAKINAKSMLAAVRQAKKQFGLNGVRCRRVDLGETVALYPQGMARVVFIQWIE